MVLIRRNGIALIALVCACIGLSGWLSNAQSSHDDTFTIAISVQTPTVHVGESPAIKEVTQNKTTHFVYAGWGEGGPLVELINNKAEDISPHILGNERKEPDVYLRSSIEKLEPGYQSRNALWHIRMEPGYLTPGNYRLRIHRTSFMNGDMKSVGEVYSNAVTFTVVP